MIKTFQNYNFKIRILLEAMSRWSPYSNSKSRNSYIHTRMKIKSWWVRIKKKKKKEREPNLESWLFRKTVATDCSTNKIIKSTVRVLEFFVSRVLVSTRVERDLAFLLSQLFFFSFFLSRFLPPHTLVYRSSKSSRSLRNVPRGKTKKREQCKRALISFLRCSTLLGRYTAGLRSIKINCLQNGHNKQNKSMN